MDKETLSNYGWIVICVLILAVMLALATPFGSFIADGFKATYAGFGMTSNNALSIITGQSNAGKTQTVKVEGIGDITTDAPTDMEFTFDENAGIISAVTSGNETETPAEIPNAVPELIEFTIGTFDTNVTTIEHKTTIVEPRIPTYSRVEYAYWVYDENGNVVAPATADVGKLNINFGTYVVYNANTGKTITTNGQTTKVLTIYATYKSLDETIYTAAYLNKLNGTTNNHIAQLNGTTYTAIDCSSAIAEVSDFTKTRVVTKTEVVDATNDFIATGTMKATANMTWAEWLASDYNITGETTPTIKTADFQDVSYGDTIVAGQSYGFFTATTVKAPGLYQTGTDVLLYSWQELLDSGVIYLTDVAWYPKGVYVDNEIAWDEFNSLAGDLVLPDDGSIETLGFEGFAGADNMTSIVIPISVNKIEDGSLAGCTKLTKIIYEGSVADWSEIGKDQSWNSSVPATYVQCRDGNAPIS